MVFLSFSGADRLQGKSAQKCGPRPSVPRNRRNSSRVRSERAGAGPLGPRGRGTAAAGRVDGARRARAQIPGVGKGLSTRFLYVFEHDGSQHVCLQMVSKFALSGSQKLEIFLPRRGGASGRRGLAPQGRRGQDFA